MPAAIDTHCSIAHSLDVLGQKWTLLIVREAFWGRTRFAEFKQRLGVAPDVLADRLASLVENGVFERRSYRDDGAREREEYVLTEAGRALLPVLGAFNAWGDEYRPTGYGSAAVFTDAASGEPLRLAFLAPDGREIAEADVAVVRGPGAQ